MNEQVLEAVAEELDVTEARYEQAVRSYQSVGEWLGRAASTLRTFGPQVYAQGSFALGTVVRPISEEEEYDVDLVCELTSRTKNELTQAQLKAELGTELQGYAQAKQMSHPEPKRRCWRLNYADGAQFHLDALPSLSDGARQRLLLERSGLDASWSDHSIAITDEEHWAYRLIADDWPASNPRGYALWFRSRMAPLFEAKRQLLALHERAKVHDIPEYRVKTPLHRAVQLLKRHRDMRFIDRPDEKPISIIITTLAARAYNNQTTITDGLRNILHHMSDHIRIREGVTWIENPTDPRENFADKWAAQPKLETAFRQWLEMAQTDFEELIGLANRRELLERAAPIFGELPVDRAATRLQLPSQRWRPVWNPFRAKHRQSPPWRHDGSASVRISRSLMRSNGFRPQEFRSNGPPLRKNADLTFEATTNVTLPYDVYWQVVNTGEEAAAAGQLRGGFDEGRVEQGYIKRAESTSYTGTHSIECFVVKDNLLVARSGLFLVNIE